MSGDNGVRTGIAVVGGGAWGTALAQAVARAGNRPVPLWLRDAGLAASIREAGENASYLPGIPLEPAIRPTTRVEDLATAEVVMLAVPAQRIREVSALLAPVLGGGQDVVCCAKGIEVETGALMSEVLAEILPGRPLSVLSGPSFATELARGLPTAVTVAAGDLARAERLAERIGSRAFRPYASADVIGVEVSGAVKNVLAIAAGIAEGHGFGENTRSALITRGIAETGRFAAALGARPETLMGLSGIGDVTLSCTSRQSRNFSLGIRLGAGETLEEIRGSGPAVVEGVHTAAAVVRRAGALGIDMPIAAAVDAVLRGAADVRSMVEQLLSRPLRAESGW